MTPAGTAAFGRAFTVGVEEEFFLVDRVTLDAVPAFSALVPRPDERLKPELFACLAETTTPICTTAGEALAELRRRREDLAARGERHRARLLAAGMHPLARSAGQPIVPKPRYKRMAADLGDAVYRQLVCGLHVHVGMPSAEVCIRAFEGVLPWLPLVLSLSASSPFAEGEDTGVLSARSGRLAELPSGGTPPVVRTWTGWERMTADADCTRLWWDARPHPRFGTLEVRIADQQTDVRRSAGLAALVQALAAAASAQEQQPYDRALYAARRLEAATSPPQADEVERLARLVEPFARRLGGWNLVEELLTGRPEALAQRELAARAGLDALLRDLADRSLA